MTRIMIFKVNKQKICGMFFFVLFLGVFLASGCSEPTWDLSKCVQDGDLIFLNTTMDVKYVGSQNCEKCHREIYEAYIKSPTGRSMSVLDSNNVIEEFSQQEAVYDSTRNFYYEMVRKEGKFFLREFRLDLEGNVLYERWQEAQYVVGSGSNLRYYLFDENGKFYQLPLTWYVHEKRWDLSPGYREFLNARFTRYLGPMCLSCHNGYMERVSSADDRYTKPYPMGIGCEACHGPGDLHSRQCEGEDLHLPSPNVLTIVNPPKLSPERRNDVCLQCHFEGVAWALKENQSWFDFRPGMLLKDHHSVYARSTENIHTFLVANSGVRLSKSRCYRGSHGNMSCDICHDSHGMLTLDKVMFNRQNCLRCHPIESVPKRASRFDESREDCIRCHMNQTGRKNTLHGVINHDHWIRINADRDEIIWNTEREDPSLFPLIHLIPVLDTKDNKQDIRLGMAYTDMYFGEGNTRIEYLDSALKYLTIGLNKNKNDAQALCYIGRIQVELKQSKKAISFLNQSIALNPDIHRAYYYLGNAFALSGEYDKAIANYIKALEFMPQEPMYLEELGNIYFIAKRPYEAVEVLQRSLEIDQQNPLVYDILGRIFVFTFNDPEIAIFYLKRVVELDPDFPDGYVNLGNAYTLVEDYPSAKQCYTTEIRMRPRSAHAYYDLGRVHYLLGENAEAREAYRMALSLDPTLKPPEQIKLN